ncbi:uncharacterized protein J7T54_007791 [Emericellopsis cladophorae]|uniref:Uncharacterized protein n=1 Tax=Emericellopsis cladophorae TaxID=2686198 RepID=A0A9P9Y7F3_9HYPO|nr:uncharacterized protein J7T54_007791 [Emericellopsis cladophorae]KAI6784698.1 hypothetical protein J7T54_007791 [Emericellopsis cladophorae]
MEDLSIVLVVIFCLIFIVAPLTGVISSYRRSARAIAATDPGPKELGRARRKLSTVTACSTHPVEDTEAAAAQLDLGECPICIGPLVPEPAHMDGSRIRLALDELTTAAASRQSKRARFCRGRLSFKGALPTTGSQRTGNGGAVEEGMDDVLTLNSCGHAFHARCLATESASDNGELSLAYGEMHTSGVVLDGNMKAPMYPNMLDKKTESKTPQLNGSISTSTFSSRGDQWARLPLMQTPLTANRVTVIYLPRLYSNSRA